MRSHSITRRSTMTTRCEGCPLQENDVCGGDGPDRADVVIVGEAPGRTEVKRGRPFVGPSGQLLDATLKEHDLDRSQVYITNTTLCRPVDKDGKDAPPGKTARNACHKRLVSEVKARKPKVILA